MKKYYYTKDVKRKANNPFYRIVNETQHNELRKQLVDNLVNFTENMEFWMNTNADAQKFVLDMISIPRDNHYGKSERGEKDGVNNSPLSALSGAVKKMNQGGPGKGDLSKNQITNVKRVLTMMNNFDSKQFSLVEWVEQTYDDETDTPLNAIRKKLNGGNTFNDCFDFVG